MIVKEWRDARWKFVLAAVALLALAAVAPRSFDRIQADVEEEIRWMEREIQSPTSVQIGPASAPPQDQAEFERHMQEQVRNMQRPEYLVRSARGEVISLQ